MLEPNFQLPEHQISVFETSKRLSLIDWFMDYIQSSVTALFVSGSMSYGQNYSVKPSSDIDMQLLVTNDSVEELLKTDCFAIDELSRAVEGYKKGFYKQFSLVFNKDNVPMECHFWDEKAFIEAVSYKNENTPRLRSGIYTPSVDYGYSFDRQESKKEYYGEVINGFAVSDFPSYRIVSEVLYLCRPITNILGLPLVKISNDRVAAAINECWMITAKKLIEYSGSSNPDLQKVSIANTLPGMNKMSESALAQVQRKTQEELEKLVK